MLFGKKKKHLKTGPVNPFIPPTIRNILWTKNIAIRIFFLHKIVPFLVSSISKKPQLLFQDAASITSHSRTTINKVNTVLRLLYYKKCICILKNTYFKRYFYFKKISLHTESNIKILVTQDSFHLNTSTKAVVILNEMMVHKNLKKPSFNRACRVQSLS